MLLLCRSVGWFNGIFLPFPSHCCIANLVLIAIANIVHVHSHSNPIPTEKNGKREFTFPMQTFTSDYQRQQEEPGVRRDMSDKMTRLNNVWSQWSVLTWYSVRVVVVSKVLFNEWLLFRWESYIWNCYKPYTNTQCCYSNKTSVPQIQNYYHTLIDY